MEIPDILTALRKSLGLTIEEFAKGVGVSHTTIKLWGKGENVSEWNRMRLLDFAKQRGVSGKLLREIERIQPSIEESRP